MNITEEHSHTIHRQVTPRALFKDKTPVLSVVALCVSPQEVVSAVLPCLDTTGQIYSCTAVAALGRDDAKGTLMI